MLRRRDIGKKHKTARHILSFIIIILSGNFGLFKYTFTRCVGTTRTGTSAVLEIIIKSLRTSNKHSFVCTVVVKNYQYSEIHKTTVEHSVRCLENYYC